MINRVLLTSEPPQPELQPLATLLHDANNKLTPIMMGISIIEIKNELSEDHLRSMMKAAEETRDEINLLLQDAKSGVSNTSQFLDILRHLHGQMRVILDPIRNIESEDMELYDEIKQSVEEFDALIERGQQCAQSQPFHEKPKLGNISQFVADIVLSYRRRYPQIHFSLTINEDCVTAFRSIDIKRVMENLLNNSVQSLPEERGEISVDLQTTIYGPENKPFVEIEEGTYVSIEIKDNGSGIPEDVMDCLPDSGITTKKHGSGIGLKSARRTISNHHGHLYIESDVGSGTKVTTLIPSTIPPVSGIRIKSNAVKEDEIEEAG